MAHLTNPTADPVSDAVQAYREFYMSSTAVPFDDNLNMAHYSAWAYLHNGLTTEQQREATRYYSRMWGNVGWKYE